MWSCSYQQSVGLPLVCIWIFALYTPNVSCVSQIKCAYMLQLQSCRCCRNLLNFFLTVWNFSSGCVLEAGKEVVFNPEDDDFEHQLDLRMVSTLRCSEGACNANYNTSFIKTCSIFFCWPPFSLFVKLFWTITTLHVLRLHGTFWHFFALVILSVSPAQLRKQHNRGWKSGV